MDNFNNYIERIEKNQEDLNNPLKGIIKYVYNERINENFFGNKENITKDDIDNFVDNINNKLLEIKKMKVELLNNDIATSEKNFLLNSLNSVGLKYIMFKKSVYLEAEKGGYKLNDRERKKILKEVNKLQNMVYGPEISSLPEEKQKVLNSLNSLLDKNNKLLSNIEKNDFIEFINSFDYIKTQNNELVKKNQF